MADLTCQIHPILSSRQTLQQDRQTQMSNTLPFTTEVEHKAKDDSILGSVSTSVMCDVEDEAELVQRSIRGSREAMCVLIELYQDIWYRFCIVQLRDIELAKDAAQETAIRFIQRLNRFQGNSQLKTWSLGIAVNVCREMRRRRKRGDMQRVEAEMLEAKDHLTGAYGNQAIEQKEMITLMFDHVNILPARQREAVLLRYFEELSIIQIAEAMGCSTGTVKSSLHKAIKKLRKMMKVKP
ncbi:ECF RNA polymerase sigma factor SigW [Poriferisphaera corsica]|uniref:ECF RNA polymerase sigma factor SigW n=1 Tax=Poriferisphaera corsica TaxID=2528020 RepID=A0A517YVI7_9BACT|nr:RNA polymerase sigma factor [Poriferisphaera corsica]QDU34192.1 ECF RNA polymerase sigma factor SigW [Poriferisphaera corsica]